MTCENCGNPQDGSYASGRFCDAKCARAFSTRSRRSEISRKVSETLREKPRVRLEKVCPTCLNPFSVPLKRKDARFCSATCVRFSDEARAKMSRSRVRAIQEGRAGSHARKRTFQHQEHEILCDSLLEYACLDWFTKTMVVLKIERSLVELPYELDGQHIYLPDFLVVTDQATYLVEVKSDYFPAELSSRAGWYMRTQEKKREALEEFSRNQGYQPFWFTKSHHKKFYRALVAGTVPT